MTNIVNLLPDWELDPDHPGRALPKDGMWLTINGQMQHITALEVTYSDTYGLEVPEHSVFGNELDQLFALVGGGLSYTEIPGLPKGTQWVIYCSPEGA